MKDHFSPQIVVTVIINECYSLIILKSLQKRN